MWMTNELRFDGCSVIVTGGGRGFGRCHTLLLASRGARVVVADYGVELDGSGSSPEPAEQVAKEIESAGGEAVACFANVADEGGALEIVDTALKAFGRLDLWSTTPAFMPGIGSTASTTHSSGEWWNTTTWAQCSCRRRLGPI